jgi:hypothetical protein
MTAHGERGDLVSRAVCMDRQVNWPLGKRWWARSVVTAATMDPMLAIETSLSARSIGRGSCRTIPEVWRSRTNFGLRDSGKVGSARFTHTERLDARGRHSLGARRRPRPTALVGPERVGGARLRGGGSVTRVGGGGCGDTYDEQHAVAKHRGGLDSLNDSTIYEADSCSSTGATIDA